MTYDEMVTQLRRWLAPYVRYGHEEPWRFERLSEEEEAGRFTVATAGSTYSIRFHAGRYLGCVGTRRTSYAGETWLRGNDLPDGPFSFETFQQIMQGILAYEWVELAEQINYKPVLLEAIKNTYRILESGEYEADDS